MNASRLALLAVLAGSAAGCTAYVEAPPPPAVAAEVEVGGGGEVDLGVFYGGLGSYGEWIERPGYGRVWYPTAVRVGWRPYLYGRWVVTDYGWTWVSYEDFGWATYHYGRWFQDAEVGWVWVPGTVWGPAWVSFQRGGGYIGWAPLPPAVGFSAGIGVQFGGVTIAAGAYSFCEERVFLHPQIATVVVAPARNVTIINNTTNITNYTVVNNKVVNQSVSVQHIEQATGQKVQRYQLAALSNKGATTIQGNQVAIYKPNLQSKAQAGGASQGSQHTAGAGANATGSGKSMGGAMQPSGGHSSQGEQVGQKAGALQNGGGSQGGTSQGGTSQGGATMGGATMGGASQRGAYQPGGGGSTQARTGQAGGGAGAAGTGTGGGNSVEDLNRRHQAEKAQLAARHATERSQLHATHQQELSNAKGGQGAGNGGANAADLRKKHDAEVRALQQQHQKEQAAMEARHKQEKAQAAAARKGNGKNKKH
jgi:hypothetical protein